jgi:hypothetical protein
LRLRAFTYARSTQKENRPWQKFIYRGRGVFFEFRGQRYHFPTSSCAHGYGHSWE